jgi:hypothetical protein
LVLALGIVFGATLHVQVSGQGPFNLNNLPAFLPSAPQL